MKFKKIMLITFLLLAVLTIGAVSASDDVSDENLTVSDGGDDAIVPDDDLVSSCDVDDEIGDDQRENISTYIHVPESVRAGELDEYDYEDNFVVTCDFYWVGDEPTGNFSVLIDDKQVYTDLVSDHYYYNYNPCFELNKLNLGFGNHTVQVKYGGDDNYLPFTETYTYELYYMKEIVPNPVLIGNWNQQQLIIDFTLNATGSLKVFIDNELVNTYDVYEKRYDEVDDELRCSIQVDLSDLELTVGNHSYELRYSGGNYPDKTIKGNFTVDSRFDVYNYNLENNYTVYLDEEIEVNICLAEDEGKLTLTLNGKDYNIEIDDDDMVYVLPELVLGKNNLTFTYENSKYPTKQVNYTIDVASRIVFSEYYPFIGYDSDKGNFSIVLPSNAKGNLSVYIGGWDNENNQYAYKLYKTAKLENGKALISVSDLNLGSYNLVANYTGNDYVSEPSFVSINIIPNIDYPKAVWSKSSNDYSVTAISPSDALGNMTISIYEITSSDEYSFSATLVDTIYNGTVKGEITKKLPKLESGFYYILVEYFESYILSNERYEFEVRDANPDITLKANIPSELVIDVWDENILYWDPTNLPDDANGKLTFYIDGKVADQVRIDPDDYMDCEYGYSKLRVGNHNWTIEFSDDSYYNPTSVNGTFTISKENGEGDISIDIERWTYMNDDYHPLATIEAPEDADGNITILIDDELKFNKNIKDCGYDDEDGECVIYAADIDYDWEVKSYRITVNYDDGVYGSYTKSRTVDVEFKYDVLINFYHEVDKNNENDSFLRVTGPEDAKGNITIKINGEIVYDQSVAGKFEDDDDLEIFLSDLTASFDYGTYPIEITYSGDKYIGENVTGNLTVTYQFYGFIDNGMSVSRIYVIYPNMYDFEFVVPEGAKGKVTVMFNGESKEVPYDSNGGKYVIDTTKLKLGQYSISAKYDGDANYPEKTVTVNFTVVPKYSSPYQVSYNEQVTFSAQVPDATGTLTLYEAFYDDYEGEYTYVPLASAPVKNGVATITMKITREMDYYLEYTSGDYKNGFISTIDIVENSPEFKVSVTPSVITAGENIIVTIDTSGVKGTIQISVDGGNSEFIDIVNGKVTKVLSNLGVGQHNINIQYIDGYEDGEGNFVESGKYYSNTFYVTVNAKPAPAPAKVDVVKLTLKKVKVKRSAKKLVLTATLKINGKAKKGLKIKFKFNKKTYTAKTNKKGVAKVTIKAKVLKKLKVGKKVTVQASYGKTVQKFTVKVKK